MYYLRTRPKADAIKFTVDQQMLKQTNKENASVDNAPGPAIIKPAKQAVQEEDDEICLSCGA